MSMDTPPRDDEIVAAINSAGGSIDPRRLISTLLANDHERPNVIEGLQRAIERGKIALDSEGMVVITADMADAA